MRILMLVSRPHIQGPLPKLTPLLVGALRDLGCEVETACWGRRRERESWPEKVIGRVRDIGHVRRMLGRRRYDVCVVTTAHDWAALLRDLPLLAVTRRRRTPTVLHFHGSQPDRVRAGGHGPFGWLSLRLVRMADAVMVLSSEERSQWEALHPSGGFYVVTNPYEHPRGRRASPATPHVPVLLFVGRLMPAKGVFDLLEAVALLNRTEPWRLLMIGDGSAEGELRSRIEVLGLGDRVTLAGYLTGERLQDAYELADVFVLPTTWAEGFPTVITEAMAAGLPVVTTRLRGAADHLVEGVHALFVPPRDPGALAARLGRLLGDPALRAAMGRANREKVKEFAPPIVGRRYLEILRAIQARATSSCAESAAG